MIEAGTVILTFFNIPSICVRFHKNIIKVVVFQTTHWTQAYALYQLSSIIIK